MSYTGLPEQLQSTLPIDHELRAVIPLPRQEIEVDFNDLPELPEPHSPGGIAARIVTLLSTNPGFGYRIGDLTDQIYPQETANAWQMPDRSDRLKRMETRIYSFLSRDTTLESSLHEKGLELRHGKWRHNDKADLRRGARAIMAWPIGQPIPEAEEHNLYTITWS